MRSRPSSDASSAPIHRIRRDRLRASSFMIGPDCKRRNHYDRQKEHHTDAGAAACAQRELEIAHENCFERCRSCAASEPNRARSGNLRRTVRRNHRDAACGNVRRDHVRRVFCPSASRPDPGSSSSHSRRLATSKRASASRRRCPAESTRAGNCASAESPSAESAASDAASPTPPVAPSTATKIRGSLRP